MTLGWLISTVVMAISLGPGRYLLGLELESRLAGEIRTIRLDRAHGGLLSYRVDRVDLFRRAATYVDRILRGEKPGDLPVQLPTKFEKVQNRKTATALGLAIPPSILLRADE